MPLPIATDLVVKRLGEGLHDSPLERSSFTREEDRILVSPRVEDLPQDGSVPPSFERGGPRKRIYFAPGASTTCAIVTCGGLCPGLNNVIRSIVLCAWHHYGIRTIHGFRYGYDGLSRSPQAEPMPLDPGVVGRIHEQGGTMLGSSRGPQDLGEMADTLQRLGVDILFCIGGDGTLRGASALAQRLDERGQQVAVVGVPKTIDNDIQYVLRSFGFSTAVEAATQAIAAANAEAVGAYHGVGLVKLMGRQSGFIAATATLGNADVNFCLVPEFPCPLDGPGGFLAILQQRLHDRRHAVVVVAEGYGQDLMQDPAHARRDLSGNLVLEDIGVFLKRRVTEHFAAQNEPLTIKYIDPSYMIRACAAGSLDAELCLRLGHNAVHAGMTGRTDLMIGYWNGSMTHVPIPAATGSRRELERDNSTWQRVLETTGQGALYRDPA